MWDMRRVVKRVCVHKNHTGKAGHMTLATNQKSESSLHPPISPLSQCPWETDQDSQEDNSTCDSRALVTALGPMLGRCLRHVV